MLVVGVVGIVKVGNPPSEMLGTDVSGCNFLLWEYLHTHKEIL